MGSQLVGTITSFTLIIRTQLQLLQLGTSRHQNRGQSTEDYQQCHANSDNIIMSCRRRTDSAHWIHLANSPYWIYIIPITDSQTNENAESSPECTDNHTINLAKLSSKRKKKPWYLLYCPTKCQTIIVAQPCRNTKELLPLPFLGVHNIQLHDISDFLSCCILHSPWSDTSSTPTSDKN